jgi:glycosyltransferase involved in cell wall biosynthesis
VIEEKTGLLVDEHDVRGMADAMRRVIHDAALATAMGEAGRDHVRTHFAMEHSLDRLWSIIAPCVDGRVPPAAGTVGPASED